MITCCWLKKQNAKHQNTSHTPPIHTQLNICRSYCYEKWGEKYRCRFIVFAKVNARIFSNIKCNIWHGIVLILHTRPHAHRFRCRWFTINCEAKRCLISQTNDKRQVQFRKFQLSQCEQQVKRKRSKHNQKRKRMNWNHFVLLATQRVSHKYQTIKMKIENWTGLDHKCSKRF